jgi:hypothetical protein
LKPVSRPLFSCFAPEYKRGLTKWKIPLKKDPITLPSAP